ncbi:MAG: hypothetical protein AAFO63_04650 [Pseudomonadota bacterium]
MSTATLEQAMSDLKAVLAEEGEMLQTGRAHEAATLINQKLTAIEAFEITFGAKELSEVTIEQRESLKFIAELAEENARHFEAIRNGLTNVISRLQSADSTAYVGSYGRQGGKVAFPDASGGFSKKV